MGVLLFDDFMVRTGLPEVLERVVFNCVGGLCTHEVSPSTPQALDPSFLASASGKTSTESTSCNGSESDGNEADAQSDQSYRMQGHARKRKATFLNNDFIKEKRAPENIFISNSSHLLTSLNLSEEKIQKLLAFRSNRQAAASNASRRPTDFLFTVSSGNPAVSLESLVGHASRLVLSAAVSEDIDIALVEKYSPHEWVYHSADAATEKLLFRGFIRVNGVDLKLSPNVPYYAL